MTVDLSWTLKGLRNVPKIKVTPVVGGETPTSSTPQPLCGSASGSGRVCAGPGLTGHFGSPRVL